MLVSCACGCGKQRPSHDKNGVARRFISGHNKAARAVVSEVDDRFWSRVDADGDCWEWTGSTREGYGAVRFRGRNTLAHRVSYEHLVGPIPEGLELDHLCRNRRCVNPDHLEPVTHRENLLRGPSFSAKNARKSHCLRGHPFDEWNTWRDRKGSRHCRACHRDKETIRRERVRANG